MILFSGAAAQEDLPIEGIEIKDMAVGDFFEMSIDMNQDGMEMTGYYRFEVTEIDKTVTVKDVEYKVVVMAYYGEGDVSYMQGIDGTWTSQGDILLEMPTGKLVKENMNTEVIIEYGGEDFKSTQNVIIIPLSKTSTQPPGTEPEIGDNWTETKTQEKTETITTEYPGGEDSSSETTTETIVTNYEYLEDKYINSDAGPFECVVIKITEESDDSEGYTIVYGDKEHGLPVKFEYFDDQDSNTGDVELVAYNFQVLEESGGDSVLDPIIPPAKSEDKSLLNLGKIGGIDTFYLLMLMVIVVLIIAAVVLLRKRGEPKEIQNIQPTQGYYQQTQYAQPQYSQPQAMGYPLCPVCRRPIQYAAQYQSWWCSSCQRYYK
jgi:outer membrane lipoprotein-sorting protein